MHTVSSTLLKAVNFDDIHSETNASAVIDTSLRLLQVHYCRFRNLTSSGLSGVIFKENGEFTSSYCCFFGCFNGGANKTIEGGNILFVQYNSNFISHWNILFCYDLRSPQESPIISFMLNYFFINYSNNSNSICNQAIGTTVMSEVTFHSNEDITLKFLNIQTGEGSRIIYFKPTKPAVKSGLSFSNIVNCTGLRLHDYVTIFENCNIFHNKFLEKSTAMFINIYSDDSNFNQVSNSKTNFDIAVVKNENCAYNVFSCYTEMRNLATNHVIYMNYFIHSFD